MCPFHFRRRWKMRRCRPKSRCFWRRASCAGKGEQRAGRPLDWRRVVALKTYGTMAVDWEERIDFDRLRRERLARAKEQLAKAEMGSLLRFVLNNVLSLTAPHVGTWAQDKNSRFALLPQNDEPILWDFGSAAKHHQVHCPWLGERSRAGIPLLRGAMSPETGRR